MMTPYRRQQLGVDILQMVFAFVFSVDFVLSMLLQQSKLRYMFRGGAKGLIDLLAIVPSLGVFRDGAVDDNLHNLGFFRFFKLAKHFQVRTAFLDMILVGNGVVVVCVFRRKFMVLYYIYSVGGM